MASPLLYTSTVFDDAIQQLLNNGYEARIPVHLFPVASASSDYVAWFVVFLKISVIFSLGYNIIYGILASKFIRLFYADWSLRKLTVRAMIKLLASIGPQKWLWSTFWRIYSSMGIDDSFTTDYMNAWRLRVAYQLRAGPGGNVLATGHEHSIYVLSDNHHPLQIPCFPSMTDYELITHVRNFYYLGRENNPRFAILSMRTINFIDKVQFTAPFNVGNTIGQLNLGRHGFGNRNIRFWIRPEDAPKTLAINTIQTDLRNAHIIGDPNVPNSMTGALNVVTMWNVDAASPFLTALVVSSLAAAVVWPWVAVKKYKADVQASVQTGFAVASFIVTAGALLLALVAYLNTLNRTA